MDRITNNESVIICAALNSLVHDVNDIARLYLYVVLSVDSAIRHRMQSYNTYESLVNRESGFEQALNRKFQEFQPIFLNAMTMLMMTGVTESSQDSQINITSKGVTMATDIYNIKSSTSKDILEAINRIHILTNSRETKELYKDLKIIL